MENYNLYSHHADFPTIAAAIKTAFPDAKHNFTTDKEWQVGMIHFKKGLYALVLIIAKGENFPPKRLAQIFGFYNINSLSPYEKVIFKKMPLTQLECAYATWRYESVNVLLWVLGFIEKLDYPDKISDGGKNLDFIFKRDRETLETAAKLRSTSEILDELDKIYRLDWICIIARFHNEAPEGNLEQGVIVERHYTLNWLTNYHGNDWDKINVHQL